MAKQTINIGSSPIMTVMVQHFVVILINDNFNELYNKLGDGARFTQFNFS